MPNFERAEMVFTSGLDEFIDKRQTVKLTALNNMVWTRARQLRPRPGYAAVSDASGRATVFNILAATQTELMGLDGLNAWQYNVKQGRMAVLPDKVRAVQVTKVNTQINANITDTTYSNYSSGVAANVDIAYVNGYYVYTYEQNGIGVHVYVEDSTSGAVALTDTIVVPNGATLAKVRASNTRVYIFWYDTGADSIKYAVIDTTVTPLAVSAPATVPLQTGPFAGSKLYDVDWNGTVNQFVIGYFSALTTARFEIFDVNVAWVSPRDVTFALAAGTVPQNINVAFGGSGANFYAAWSASTAGNTSLRVGMQCTQNVNAMTLNFWDQAFETWTVGGAGTTRQQAKLCQNIGIVESLVSPLEAYVVATIDDANTDGTSLQTTDSLYSWRVRNNGVTGVAIQSNTYQPGLSIWSRPFQVGSPAIFAVIALSQVANTFFLVDVTSTTTAHINPSSAGDPPRPAAMTSCRVGFGPQKAWDVQLRLPCSLCSVVSGPGGNTAPTTLVWQAQLNTLSLSHIVQRCIFDFTWGQENPARGVSSWHMPGGIPQRISRARAIEAMMLAPCAIYCRDSGNAGLLSAGTYVYQACYAIITDDGVIARGPFGPPFSYTSASNHSVNVFLVGPPPSFAAVRPVRDYNGANAPDYNIIVEVYRTQVNQSTLFLDLSSATSGTSTVLGLGYQIDNNPDNSIVVNPPAYWNGGGFANVCPPPHTIAVRIKDRIWIGGTDTGNEVYYSDSITSISPTTWHDENNIYIDAGGRVTGIAGLDEKIFIFKANRIFWLAGEPGNSAGNGSTLSTPQELPGGSLGCLDQRSIAVIGDGIIFQSARGIELIDRSLQVQYIGAPVANTLANTGTGLIVSATVVPEQHRVELFIGGSSTSLVYDTLLKEWSTFTRTGSIKSSTTYQSLITWTDQSLNIYQEIAAGAANRYLDAGAYITCSFTTAHIHMLGMAGYSRTAKAHLLGEWNSASSNCAGVQLVYSVDYASAASQTYTWTNAQIAMFSEVSAGGIGARVQISARLQPQKVEAFQLAYTSLAPPSLDGNAGIYLNALTIEWQKKSAPYPIPGTNRR